MKCRFCQNETDQVFLDLGFSPPSNAYLDAAQLRGTERYFPLRVLVCDQCWLVQIEDNDSDEGLFPADYAYFSSVSQSWLDHASRYVDMITERLELSHDHFVIEVASNDGYLLKNFLDRKIPCLGIEPTLSTATAARAMGIQVINEFFGESLGAKLRSNNQLADLIVCNNVYAHIPDIRDFTRGLQLALKPGGTITIEVQHLLKILEKNEFDTIYHEHFYYLSVQVIDRVFRACGLRVYDVETLPTHGGSIRVYGCHHDDGKQPTDRLAEIIAREKEAGLNQLAVYLDFQDQANTIKNDLLIFLIQQQKLGKTVVAYGAAAKGATLLNYAGVRNDLVRFVCDAAPSKQGKFMPGSHLPIMPPQALVEHKPDYVLILPWNLADEITRQYQSVIGKWGGQFVVPVPQLTIIPAP